MTRAQSMHGTHISHRRSARMSAELTHGDAPEHLTFDEMRELPMRVALGFDTED